VNALPEPGRSVDREEPSNKADGNLASIAD
jgi:hypothetical protein